MPRMFMCPPRAAAGAYTPKKGKASYGMGRVIATIAPAHQSTKPAQQIVPARWIYRPGRVNVLVKGGANVMK